MNILMLKMIVVHKFFCLFFLIIFYPQKGIFYKYKYMSLLSFSFVQYAVYDHVLSSFADII